MSDLLVKVVFVGALITFVGSVLFATVVFDHPIPKSGADVEMEMGVSFAATDAHIEVFQDAVLLLQISADIKDIVKTDENGENPEPGGLVDLFPVGSAAHGRGKLEFRIKSIGREAMPDLRKRSQATVPMAYLRQSTFSELAKSAVKLSVFAINNAALGAWLGVLFAIGCIIAGVGVLYMDNKKTPVEEMEEEDEE